MTAGYKTIYNLTKNLLLLLSCALPAIYGLRQIICNDVWLHIKTGWWIWNNYAIPRTQLYSFLLGPKEWVDHEWLFQAIIYPIYYLTGVNGLILLRFLIICLLLSIFFKVAKGTDRYFGFSCLTVIMSVSAASPRFLMRPELASLFFTVLFLYLIKSYRDENRIFLLIPLQILWVNMHGYFIIGPVLVLFFLIAKMIEAKVALPFSWNENRLDNRSLRRVIYVIFLLFIVLLFNPYLLQGALYPFKVLGRAITDPMDGNYALKFITELQPLPFVDIILKNNLFFLNATIIIFFFSILLNIRRADVFDLIVFFIFLAFSLTAKRHIGLFAVSLGILALFNFKSAEEKRGTHPLFLKVIPTLGVVLLLVNIFSIIPSFINMAKARYIYNLKGESKGCFFGGDKPYLFQPTGAATFIKENRISGNVYNIFNSGSYLIFRLYPECKIFIDGRTEVYGDLLLKVCSRIFSKPQIIDGIKKNLGIDCAVLPCNKRVASLFNYFYENKKWKLVFFDGQSCVFVTDSPKFRSLIEDKEVVLKNFAINPDKQLIETAKNRRFFPSSFYNAGIFFYYVDMPEKALEAIKIAEDIYPKMYEAVMLKAMVLFKLDRKQEALEEFLKAAEINKADPATFKNIGTFYAKTGQLEVAKEYFKAGLKVHPRNKELQEYLDKIDDYMGY